MDTTMFASKTGLALLGGILLFACNNGIDKELDRLPEGDNAVPGQVVADYRVAIGADAEGDRITHIVLDIQTPRNEPVEDADVDARLVPANPELDDEEVSFSETDLPGRYEADVSLSTATTWTIHARVARDDGGFFPWDGHVPVRPVLDEMGEVRYPGATDDEMQRDRPAGAVDPAQHPGSGVDADRNLNQDLRPDMQRPPAPERPSEDGLAPERQGQSPDQALPYGTGGQPY